MKIAHAKDVPQSVKEACFKVWDGQIPKNITDIAYTYGDTCYTPVMLTEDLIRHESKHTEQQSREGMTPDLWWTKYGEDKEFRYQQELEAYKVQKTYIEARYGKREAFNAAKKFAYDMSSPMYGNMVSYQKALFDLTCK